MSRRLAQDVSKRKKRGQPMDSAGTASRRSCGCMAVHHALFANCTACGRILCEAEGEGPCFFCNSIVRALLAAAVHDGMAWQCVAWHGVVWHDMAAVTQRRRWRRRRRLVPLKRRALAWPRRYTRTRPKFRRSSSTL
jgi:hypothetical protein